MSWIYEGSFCWSFFPWQPRGWHLSLVVLGEESDHSGHFTVASHAPHGFFRMTPLTTASAFIADLEGVLEEASRLSADIPSSDAVREATTDDFVEDLFVLARKADAFEVGDSSSNC